MISKNKIKVLWLASWYPNREDSIYGIFIKKQAVATSAFCDVSVLYAHESEGNAYEIDIQNSPFLEVIVYYPKSTFLFFKWIRYIKALLKGFNEIKNRVGEPELVHVHVVHPVSVMAMYLKIFHQIKYVVSEHSTFYKEWVLGKIKRQYLIKLISKFGLSQAELMIVLSENHAEVFKKLNLINHFRTVPNVVNTDIFHLPLENRPTNHYKFRLLHVSSLYERDKNVKGILRGIKLLSERRQDFELHIIGSEKYHADLKNEAISLRLSENSLHFQGFVTETGVAQAMQSADIFILFSHFEGLPCVILEALSTGLPVVASETGGMSEWIDDETGKLVPINNENALAEALNNMMNNYQKYQAEKIRQRVVDNCSPDRVGHQIFEIYKQVLTTQ